MSDQTAPGVLRPRPPLLDFADWLCVAALTALGMGLRLAYFSGYGLGDDILLRNFIKTILSSGMVPHDNFAYRVTWWLPTVIICRLWGLTELPFLAPILVTATCAFAVVYAFGKALYGRRGAVIAGLLFVACPLDFAWATMMTPDIQASLCSALALLCVLRAAEQLLPNPTRRLLAGAAFMSWLAFHAKVACAPMAAPILYAFWRHRRVLAGHLWAFFLPACVLFGGTVAVSYALAGDPIAPYSSEITAQGLSGPVAVQFHRLTEGVFWTYLRWLFYRNQYGSFFYSVYPHVLVAFVITAPLLRLRLLAPEVWVWMLAVFLAMQFNIQRAEGVWVAGFRNIRHTHIFVYPMILLLAGYLTALATRWPRVAGTFVAALAAFSLWESVSIATKTQVAFQDRRQASWFLATLPAKTVYSDFQLNTWRAIIPGEESRQPFRELPGFLAAERTAVLASVTEGYLVTGGAREPWYGCIDCIPREAEISSGQWRLVKAFPEDAGPITTWRPEPLKVWEYVGADNQATPAPKRSEAPSPAPAG